MWERYRKWRHAAVVSPAIAVLLVLRAAPDGSAIQYSCLALIALAVVAYVVEEVAWNLAGKGRPFGVSVYCPSCGATL